MIRYCIEFRRRVVFLENYDIALAQELFGSGPTRFGKVVITASERAA